MERIKVDNVSLSYPDTRKGHKKEKIPALHGISLSVHDGEFLVIIGPMGSGKSSLLKAMLGIVPYEGTVEISGIDSATLTPRAKRLSYVSQSFLTYSFMSVYANIALPLKAERVPIKEIEKRVDEMAEEFGISHLLSRKPTRLSQGQQQRVAIARALIRPSDAYFFDEPFSNLDPVIRVDLRKKLKEYQKSHHATMVFVTHDINDALLLADRIAVIIEGRLAALDTPSNILQSKNPEIQALVGGIHHD
ncbi:MAG: ATP-binding cassette domain-containing protein [Bacilli bacterium]|nr:ATP-binding cassette domain-containing protein [Bacilli bacterium]